MREALLTVVSMAAVITGVVTLWQDRPMLQKVLIFVLSMGIAVTAFVFTK
jgi:hypothetical protein